jgi:hypothetical protein
MRSTTFYTIRKNYFFNLKQNFSYFKGKIFYNSLDNLNKLLILFNFFITNCYYFNYFLLIKSLIYIHNVLNN